MFGFEDTDDFVLPDNIIDLHDTAHELWMQYFKPPQPMSSAQKRALRERYNLVAKAANDMQGHASLQHITPSTQWIPKSGQEDLTKAKAAKPISKPAASTTQPAQAKIAPLATLTGGGSGKIAEIIALHLQGKSKKEIIELGYNKSTVNRQVGEYIKKHQK